MPKRERCAERKRVVSGRRGGDEMLRAGGWFSLSLEDGVRRSSVADFERVSKLWFDGVDGIFERQGFRWSVLSGAETGIGESWSYACSGFADRIDDDISTSSSHSLTLDSLFSTWLIGRNGRMKGTPCVEWHSSSSELGLGVCDALLTFH